MIQNNFNHINLASEIDVQKFAQEIVDETQILMNRVSKTRSTINIDSTIPLKVAYLRRITDISLTHYVENVRNKMMSIVDAEFVRPKLAVLSENLPTREEREKEDLKNRQIVKTSTVFKRIFGLDGCDPSYPVSLELKNDWHYLEGFLWPKKR